MSNKEFKINAERTAELQFFEFKIKLGWMVNDVLEGSLSREKFDVQIQVLKDFSKKADILIAQSIEKLGRKNND